MSQETKYITHISAEKHKGFFEFLKYKELVYFFTWREFKVRYKQTFFGVIWALAQPLLFAGIIGIILTRRAGLSFGFEQTSDIVVVFLSFSLWQFFQGSFGGGVNSISGNKPLIKKIYFPKVILILSYISSRTVDFLLQAIVLLLLLVASGSHFNPMGFIAIFVGLIIVGLTALGASLILAPLNVKYRDVSIVLPFLIRIMFFTTPIWYPFHILPETLQKVLLFNPIVSVLEFSREALFSTAPNPYDFTLLLYSLVSVAVLLFIGVFVFKSREGSLADYM